MVNSILNKEYKKIQHQFDTWHASKGIVKQLTAKGKSTECSDLEPWIQSVSNHLWWCCATCGGNAQLLREKWLSVLSHITNKHTWTGNSKFHKCAHRRLTAAEKKATKWLKPESAAFKALQAIVTKKSLLTAMAKLTKFCHTGELEVYHNMLLKYCPKRQHFSYDVMKARLMLSAYGWNNTKMEQKKDRSGEPATCTSVVYSKRRKMFVLKKRYTKLKSDHMFRLVKEIYEVHELGRKLPPMKRPLDLPRNVSKVPKPPKSELALKFKSRFSNVK